MTATRIEAALCDLPAARQGAEEAARMGFLEWVLSLPEGASPSHEAQAALARRAGRSASGAAGLFIGYLEQAAAGGFAPAPVRRGGRRARFH